jgi:hypothetical protein
MGRGRGGYTEKQQGYKDSGGFKVTDKGAIWVAERYIEDGYESVFRQRHDPETSCDLTIKTSDDTQTIKNIEVKQVTSQNPSKIATHIKEANEQIAAGDTIALYFPNRTSSRESVSFVEQGIAEARRKNYIKGPVEVWFSDKKKKTYN